MKAILIGFVLVFVAAMGILQYAHGERPTDPLGPTKQRIEKELKRTYTVPKCAQHWPPTCPGSKTKEVPACAQHWPPTCKPASILPFPNRRYVVPSRNSVVSTTR